MDVKPLSRALLVAVFVLGACASPPSSAPTPPRPSQTFLIFPREFSGLVLAWPCGGDCTASEARYQTTESVFVRFQQPSGTPVLYSGKEGYFVNYSSAGIFDVLWIHDRAGWSIRYYIPAGSGRPKPGLQATAIARGATVATSAGDLESIGSSFAVDIVKTVVDKTGMKPDLGATLDQPVPDLHITDFQR